MNEEKGKKPDIYHKRIIIYILKKGFMAGYEEVVKDKQITKDFDDEHHSYEYEKAFKDLLDAKEIIKNDFLNRYEPADEIFKISVISDIIKNVDKEVIWRIYSKKKYEFMEWLHEFILISKFIKQEDALKINKQLKKMGQILSKRFPEITEKS